jgi:hypothetical protein
MPETREEVRRMRETAQAHLMHFEDDGCYVARFQHNPQGARILANEFLETKLAARLGLPALGAEVVQVGEELIAHTEDLVMQLGPRRAPLRAGRQFGSCYPQ